MAGSGGRAPEQPIAERRNGGSRRKVGGRRITDLEDPNLRGYARLRTVAAYFDVSVEMLEKWSDAGLLKIVGYPGARRIALDDIRRFRATYHPLDTSSTKTG